MFFTRIAVPMRAVMIALILAAVAVPASAQRPSDLSLKLAKEIATLKGATHLFDPIVPGVIEQAKNVLAQTNPLLLKDLNEVAAKLREFYAKRTSELNDKIVGLYATQFTESELKTLVVFYKTPLGKKVINEEPRILDQTMREAQDWANKLSQEVLIRFREEMKKKGHDL